MDHRKQPEEILNEPVAARDAPIVVPNHIVANQFAPGNIIEGRYEVLNLIGQGGCGSVYKVRQIVLKQELALKTLNPVRVSKLTMLRLQKEAEAASRLNHPNLVKAIDFGLINQEQPYLVMEFVDGPTLAEYLKPVGRLPVAEALALFIQICDGMEYAHEHGVIHRDIKPSNIILFRQSGTNDAFVAKIVDFGIAKLQFAEDNLPTLTKTGDIFGTPLYMSPEQCLGEGIDCRTDIYSLGCVLFECLAGTPPYPGNNALETMMMHGTSTIPSLKEASLGSDFPPAVERIVAKMLAKDTRDRYQKCSDAAEDLRRFLQGELEAGSISVSRKAKITKEHRNYAAALSCLVGLAAGALGYTIATVQRPPKDTTPQHILPPATLINLPTASIGYFRHSENEPKTFEFPKINIGTMSYLDKNHKIHRCTADEPVTFPADAKLVFAPNAVMYEALYNWGRFRTEDLAGIDLDLVHRFKGADQEEVIYAALCQENLSYLAMRSVGFESRPFSIIGTLPRLSWLNLHEVQVKRKQVSGDDIAALPNLPGLKVLRVCKFIRPTAMLKALAHAKQIRRLSLIRTALTAEDIDLIMSMKELDTLQIAGCQIPMESRLIERLRELPNLKRVDLQNDQTKFNFSELSHLKSLNTLVVDPDQGQARQYVAKSDTVQFAPKDWFDPLANPDANSLW